VNSKELPLIIWFWINPKCIRDLAMKEMIVNNLSYDIIKVWEQEGSEWDKENQKIICQNDRRSNYEVIFVRTMIVVWEIYLNIE